MTKTWRAPLAAAALSLVVYAGALRGPFLGDDISEIQGNERVHSISNIPDLFRTGFWGKGVEGNPIYRPLVATTSTLLWQAGGGSPLPFHVWNLLLHAASSALVVLLGAGLGLGTPAALLAGLLFAVHPTHTEAVAWISGQPEPLAALLLLVAWKAHLRGRAMLAAACLVPALLSKEGAVVFPVLVLAGDWFRARTGGYQRSVRDGARALILYGSVIAAYLLLRWLVLGHVLGGGAQSYAREMLNPLLGTPALTRLLTATKVLGLAIRQSTVPYTLCFDYGYNQVPVVRTPVDPAFLASILTVLLIAVAVRMAGRYRDVAFLGTAVFAATWAPTSNLLIPGLAIFAERNLYLPLLGVCLLLAALLSASRGARWIAAGIVLLMAGRTFVRGLDYADAIGLYTTTARSCPESAWAHHWLGMTLRQAGRIDEARRSEERALSIAPDLSQARAELGLLMMVQGDYATAEVELERVLRERPSDWLARSNLAYLHAETGKLDRALDEYAALAREQPRNVEVLGNYASVLLQAGRGGEARALYEQLDREEPWSPVGPNGLGGIAAAEGRWDLAAARFQEAQRRDPANVNAIYNGALALAQTGRRHEALRLLDEALARGIQDAGLEQLRARLRSSGAVP